MSVGIGDCELRKEAMCTPLEPPRVQKLSNGAWVERRLDGSWQLRDPRREVRVAVGVVWATTWVAGVISWCLVPDLWESYVVPIGLLAAPLGLSMLAIGSLEARIDARARTLTVARERWGLGRETTWAWHQITGVELRARMRVGGSDEDAPKLDPLVYDTYLTTRAGESRLTEALDYGEAWKFAASLREALQLAPGCEMSPANRDESLHQLRRLKATGQNAEAAQAACVLVGESLTERLLDALKAQR